ncbi:hypothetical protein H6F43_21600 [Leptolyngbya sp. FACHB-36]|nr:hypothetical protein [Leptolyngbya sp. FACHB-36]MBD2022782.1 hypothetical protein [Leptolyngbya sp. FACHB-36]
MLPLRACLAHAEHFLIEREPRRSINLQNSSILSDRHLQSALKQQHHS